MTFKHYPQRPGAKTKRSLFKNMAISGSIKHVASLCLLTVCLLIFTWHSGVYISNDDPIWTLNPIEEYGILPSLFLYLLRFTIITAVPLAVANFLGIICFNMFPDSPSLNGSPLLGPFICFRVVTRGEYPELVCENVKLNIDTCLRVGLDNFIVEVVTDKAIDLPKLPRSQELVVPKNYCTSNGSLYKSRALQFCLEDGINLLNDDDWIVHLDEETLLTESSVIGIFNFVSKGDHEFGQGVITYAHGHVVNWCTTLIDSVRVGIDYGALRFTFRAINKPIFNWKGSFMVASAGAERKVSFDHGPEGSIAEDCFFAMVAQDHGYTFDFIEGEMHEQSTFTFLDFLRQRKRWMQGINLAYTHCHVPFQQKFGIMLMVYSMYLMPITSLTLPLTPLFPIPMFRIINFVCGFLGGMFVFLFIFGTLKSLNHRRFGIIRTTFLCACTILLIPVAIILENSAILWGIVSKKNSGFHIVRKDSPKLTKIKSFISIA